MIDGKTIGCIQISAPGVVIRNSKISCGGNYAVYVDDKTSTQTVVTIEDSEIDCKGTPGSAGVGEADFTVRRVEITNCENGLDVNQNAVIEDNYVHDLYNSGSSHSDGLQFGTGHWNGSGYVCGSGCVNNVTIRHNTIYGMGADGSFGTSAIIDHSFGSNTNILIDSNLLAGGAVALYCSIGFTGHELRRDQQPLLDEVQEHGRLLRPLVRLFRPNPVRQRDPRDRKASHAALGGSSRRPARHRGSDAHPNRTVRATRVCETTLAQVDGSRPGTGRVALARR